ncbi:MAG: hypothetical protein KME10_07630 [Plectolyngbya sp. WJT66-NPBG17]|nr:hypothetical protein [Plectolyngbya sp. WJT66-NPBG17]
MPRMAVSQFLKRLTERLNCARNRGTVASVSTACNQIVKFGHDQPIPIRAYCNGRTADRFPVEFRASDRAHVDRGMTDSDVNASASLEFAAQKRQVLAGV